MSVQLLALAGSLRRESYNLKLLRHMVQGAEAAGATVKVIDWADYPMPLLNEDEEKIAVPAAARAFKAEMRKADGFLIAQPEYNGGYSAAMKNAIDWASRTMPDDAPGSVFKNKTVAISGATIGRWGAVRSIRQLREVLGYLGCIVLPDTVSVIEAAKAFDASGKLLDDKQRASAEAVGAALVKATAALKG